MIPWDDQRYSDLLDADRAASDKREREVQDAPPPRGWVAIRQANSYAPYTPEAAAEDRADQGKDPRSTYPGIRSEPVCTTGHESEIERARR